MVLNMYFNKELVKKVFKLTFPMIITELAHSIYSLTDTFFVKGLGADALAGVGLASYLFWIFMVFITMFNSGLTIYVSQAYGAGENIKAKKSLSEVLLYGSLFSLFIGLIGYWIGFKILILLNGELNTVVYNAYDYFKWRVISLPIVFAVGSIDSTLIAIGWTIKSMKANVIGVLLNIILDPIMIYGYYGFPRMGVEGAALATIFSNIATGFINTYYLLKSGLKPEFVIETGILNRILNLGIPIAVERAVFSIGNNLYVAIIARCGSIALAAHNIGLRIESLIYMPGFAFSIAASVLVGQAIGNSDYVYAKKIGREVVKTSTLFMTILGIIIAIVSRYVVEPFSPNEDVRMLASTYLILAGLSETGLALSMSTSGVIRGSGNTRIPLLINVFSFYVIRLLVAFSLVNSIGVIGAWIGMFIDLYVRGLIIYVVFEKYFYKLARRVI
uniref:Multidrug-efflux transporter n=1 Tax=Staphylothermus marinus TaxID=2280 RepID=A0A7C4D880_STAMA